MDSINILRRALESVEGGASLASRAAELYDALRRQGYEIRALPYQGKPLESYRGDYDPRDD